MTWYRTTRRDFAAPDWPSMPTALTAKRKNLGRKAAAKLTLPEVVRGVDAIPEKKRAIFWVFFFTQARKTEGRAVLGMDYARPDVRICRSAESKSGTAEIAATTKTGETGTYTLPESVCDLIDLQRKSIDPRAPLFLSQEEKAGEGAMYSDDALEAIWRAASKRAGIPYVPIYRAFKHTQVSALLGAGLSVEKIVDQCRWTSAAMLEHYDERKDERRGEVVGILAGLVDEARKPAKESD